MLGGPEILGREGVRRAGVGSEVAKGAGASGVGCLELELNHHAPLYIYECMANTKQAKGGVPVGPVVR